jgi:hypothetical protein
MSRAHRLFLFASFAAEMTVPVLRHPASAGEMAVMDTARSFRLGSGIDAEDDCNRFAPVRAVSFRIEHAHIFFHMRSVIVREFCADRRNV